MPARPRSVINEMMEMKSVLEAMGHTISEDLVLEVCQSMLLIPLAHCQEVSRVANLMAVTAVKHPVLAHRRDSLLWVGYQDLVDLEV
jgi:hypothetical protein